MKTNLLCGVMIPHLCQVLIKGIFIEGSFAQLKYLQGLTVLEKDGSAALN